MKKFLVFLLILIVVGIGVLTFLPKYLSNTTNNEDIEIIIKNGDNLTTISQRLYDGGVIKSKYWFRYRGSDIASDLKPGSYIIPANTNIYKIYEIIRDEDNRQFISITFPEGFSLYRFAERIEEEGIATSEEFIDETNRYFENHSYDFDTSNHYFNMEGYLFPDTYYFGKEQTLEEVVETLVNTMDNTFSQEDLEYMEESNLNKHKVLTIASLIEREAINDEEKSRISGVIYNRLNMDMLLQIDATVIYGKGKGREHVSRVFFNDLKEDNPYNTYKNKGLPPGPIASPGKESIEAALYPEEHNYLYYVLGENGHVFSKTYEEHEKNVKAYRDRVSK